MRVGSLQMTTRYMNQLNRTYENQTKLMEQSDGAKLHRPSDDPIGYSKYLRYSISYGENNQYQTNVKTAISWMKNSDSSLVDITNCFKTIVEKANQAQGTNNDSDMNAIASEMLVQAQQAVADANIQINGRYLFSGQRDLVQPYNISYEEKVDRGLAKTLDDKQSDFFSGDALGATKSGDITQMLTMKGSDGNKYFLNTRTGNVYTENFVEEDYKVKISDGHSTVAAGDEAGTVTEFVPTGTPPTAPNTVSDYFDGRGVITAAGKNFSSDITVDGNTVTLTFETVNQYIATYQGDKKQFSMVKENGAVQPASDTVNASGIEIAGFSIFDNPESGNEYSGANAFNDMLTVVAMCERGEKEGTRWMNSDGKTLANNAYNTVLNAESKLAARQQVYSDCEDMLTTQNETILGDITDVHSTDVAKLAVEMMTAQTIYQLSLSVGSRILPPTLADYL
ncbi:MAG: hypothetical protein IJ812_07895 [Schwartzia sp.]|nr:hypothetical protein [Schwartzia sp. (in: firmicutes)]